MLGKLFTIGLLSTIAAIALGDEIDIEKIKSQLPEGILPEGFNTTALPSADDALKIFKEKCDQTAGNEEAFKNADIAKDVFKDCLMGLVDFETLQQEMEKAQPNGDLDTVFNKYCRKRTIAIDCMKNFTLAIEPCLNKEEVASKKTFDNIFTNLLNFVCHKDGDQIALFIAEKGPECFNSKKDALIHCINSTMAHYIPSETPTLADLPQFVMGAEQCNDMDALQKCVVKELEKCEESTPANLVDSMFKFVRNETPCANMSRPEVSTRSDANTRTTSSLTMFTTSLLAIIAFTLL